MKANNTAIRILGFLFFLIFLAILAFFLWKPLAFLFSDIAILKNFILKFGFYSFLIFILLVILQVMLAPVPGQIIGVAGGYVFGAFFGTIYSMIGLVIGSFIVFSLSRKFGRPFVELIIKKETLKKFDFFSHKNASFILFLLYLLPAIPDDALCYIAGLTKIRIRTLLIISAIGRFPGFLVLNIVGSGLSSQNYVFSLSLLIIAVAFSFFIFKDITI